VPERMIARERIEAREIRRRAPHPAGERPRPDLPPGTDLLPLIRHIVVLMQENHSYDNYLGSIHNSAGYPLHHLTSTLQQDGNPTQTWRASGGGRPGGPGFCPGI
jgi:phospholipase C